MSATAFETLRSSNARRPARKVDALLFSGLTALIIFGPLAFGAVEDWAVFAQECVAVVLLGIWVAQSLLRQNSGFHPNRLYAPMGALALIVAAQIVFRTAAYSYATQAAALQFTACFIIFFLANQVL